MWFPYTSFLICWSLYHHRTLLVHLTLYPVCFIGYSLSICVLAKSMFHAIYILSNILGIYLTFLIVPLTLTCAMHFTIFPITLIFMIFSIKCAITFQHIIYELSLIICAIRVLKFTLAILIPMNELPWIDWSITISLGTISIFHALWPLPLVHHKWFIWFKYAISWWFIFLPLSIIGFPFIVNIKTFSVFHVIFPFSFIIVTIMWEEQSKTIFLISSNLGIADENSISHLKFLKIFRFYFFNYAIIKSLI